MDLRAPAFLTALLLAVSLLGCHPMAARPATPGERTAAAAEDPPMGPSGKPMIHPPHEHGDRPPGARPPPLAVLTGDDAPPVGTRLVCPVCGDEFDVDDKQPTRHYKGKVFIFCCERCLPHFDKNPEMFLNQ